MRITGYAHEGVNIHVRKPLPREWSATLDAYAVNGLQQGGGGVFFLSRSYRDNNSSPTFGGRATIGGKRVRFGGSVASGELQFEGAPLQNYTLGGADVTVRLKDRLRVFYEYAIREEEPFPSARNIIYGNVVEAEVRVWDCPKVSLLARYDTLEHRGTSGTMSTERITAGVNLTLRGGSLLILNHEHWIFDDASHANILGVRWTAAF